MFLILLGVMYLTNPTKKDYTNFVKEKLADKVNENNTSGKLDNVIGSLLSGAGAKIAASMTERKDYYLGSIYILKTDDKTYRYLGVFSSFIPLQTDNPLENINGDSSK